MSSEVGDGTGIQRGEKDHLRCCGSFRVGASVLIKEGQKKGKIPEIEDLDGSCGTTEALQP